MYIAQIRWTNKGEKDSMNEKIVRICNVQRGGSMGHMDPPMIVGPRGIKGIPEQKR